MYAICNDFIYNNNTNKTIVNTNQIFFTSLLFYKM